MGLENGAVTMENSLEIFGKLNMDLKYDPLISLLSINLRECKMYVYTETGTQMFIAVLLILSQK